ncbi:ImmA/IrrE family metallo-endopeptidase [Paracoccus sp. 08]|uniref:ImmA/IrrE family metallo-endopeptidase n=1 Tax=Paracoccus sp. 08 TaxID=2606624 RepID=UPI0020948017|nr:ImmA/IrrE family metallo-endopeptidase [Paracoccus sp. 08]MCO6364374.1 ImmA/IrrE family metallo-endopeptidase [Paracoccus sp. 08]
MASNYAQAVRKGTLSAGRLLRELGVKEQIEQSGGAINIFAAISALDVPLLFRPLDGLLGAFLNFPTRGILVTTQRPLSIQRFTAAHELGHCMLDHKPSLDDENILRRMVVNEQPTQDLQEVEADGFATAFLLPKWLIANHMKRHGITIPHLRRPNVIYQLSLRLGVSYEAFCWTLVRYRMIEGKQARELLLTPRRAVKEALLEGHRPTNYRGDVWLLTERDAGSRIDGSRNDLFILKLTEHSNGGYLWNIDELRDSGFAVVRDEVAEVETESIGDPGVRRVTAQPPQDYRGRLVLDEVRPWDSDQVLTRLELDFDFTGPEEEGLSRIERRERLMLEAV